MRLFSLLLALLIAAQAGTAVAQITPDVDLKGGGGTFSLGFTPPKALAGLKINYGSPSEMAKINLNFLPAVQMLAMLEGRGAKIGAQLREIKGSKVVDVTVDGRPIEPIAVNCNSCVIVFEY